MIHRALAPKSQRYAKQYGPGDVCKDIVQLLKHIASFWSDGGWAPQDATESLRNINFARLLSLAEELPNWYSRRTVSEGQLVLAWVAIGAIAEGSLQWFLSVYKRDYMKDPYFRAKTPATPIPPEDLFFARMIAFFGQHVWHDEHGRLNDATPSNNKVEMTRLLDRIRENRNSIHCHKDLLANLEEWRSCLVGFLVVLCDLESRVPYPDEQYAYPDDVSTIVAHYDLISRNFRDTGQCPE